MCLLSPQKFSVEETEVHRALLDDNPHDQLYIAYHLILDNKLMIDSGMYKPLLCYMFKEEAPDTFACFLIWEHYIHVILKKKFSLFFPSLSLLIKP